MKSPEPLTHTQHLLTPLRESIFDKPPYTSGTLRLPNSCFSLFYEEKKDGNNTRSEDYGLTLPSYLKSIG
jgi:hypothetical protein